MTTSALTDTQLALLRAALGLSHYTTKPTRNWLPESDARGKEKEILQLEQMGYLKKRRFAGPGGYETAIEITNEGMARVLPPAGSEGDGASPAR